MAVGRVWSPRKCPTTHDDLRAALIKLVKKRIGGKLISSKFTKDHIYAGHNGGIKKLGATLAKLRDRSLSTIMITSMTQRAQAEVLNWIDKVPDRCLVYRAGSWTINTNGFAVGAVKRYKFATVDLPALKAMNSDDVVKKSRNWIKVADKVPSVACQFDSDGTPVIYHLDY